MSKKVKIFVDPAPRPGDNSIWDFFERLDPLRGLERILSEKIKKNK